MISYQSIVLFVSHVWVSSEHQATEADYFQFLLYLSLLFIYYSIIYCHLFIRRKGSVYLSSLSSRGASSFANSLSPHRFCPPGLPEVCWLHVRVTSQAFQVSIAQASQSSLVKLSKHLSRVGLTQCWGQLSCGEAVILPKVP